MNKDNFESLFPKDKLKSKLKNFGTLTSWQYYKDDNVIIFTITDEDEQYAFRLDPGELPKIDKPQNWNLLFWIKPEYKDEVFKNIHNIDELITAIISIYNSKKASRIASEILKSSAFSINKSESIITSVLKTAIDIIDKFPEAELKRKLRNFGEIFEWNYKTVTNYSFSSFSLPVMNVDFKIETLEGDIIIGKILKDKSNNEQQKLNDETFLFMYDFIDKTSSTDEWLKAKVRVTNIDDIVKTLVKVVNQR